MRRIRFGLLTLLLALTYCGAIAVRRNLRAPAPPPAPPRYPVTDRDVVSARSRLCRLARSERAFYVATGRYADRSELRANGNSSLLPADAPPYSYSIPIPVPHRFVIIAHAFGPLHQQPPALVVDDRLQMCTVRSELPNYVWRLDDPPQRFGRVAYHCARCD